MTSITRYAGLAATQRGRTGQMNRAFRGMADDIERRRAVQGECDDLGDLSREQLVNLVTSLRLKLDEAEDTIDRLSAYANSNASAQDVDVADYWTTKQVAKKSGVAICTIVRNAQSLGGWQLQSGDWLFPVGTTYGRRRKGK